MDVYFYPLLQRMLPSAQQNNTTKDVEIWLRTLEEGYEL
jgi:hypothetical protein